MSGYPAGGAQDGRRPVIINAYPNNGATLPRRNQTLTRPDRQPTLRRTLMRNENRPPPAARAGATSGRTLNRPTNLMPMEIEEEEPTGCWTLTSKILTFWAIGPVRSLFGVGKSKDIIQAWREKMALCIIIFFCWCIMGFFTVGLQPTLCPEPEKEGYDQLVPHDSEFTNNAVFLYMGKGYSTVVVNNELTKRGIEKIPDAFIGKNITPLFRKCKATSGYCSKVESNPCVKFYSENDDEIKCKAISRDNKEVVYDKGCINSSFMDNLKANYKFQYEWDEDIVKKGVSSYTVYNGFVFDNMDKVLKHIESLSPQTAITTEVKKKIERAIGTDGTRYFLSSNIMKDLSECLLQNNAMGFLRKKTMGCFLSEIITWLTTIAILGVVLTRFVMAIVFSWFVSGKLAQPKPGNKIRELYTICLVTAYSEGEEGIRCTLNSLATTTYPDKKELLFVIADGIIIGSGNDRSTPDICTAMIIEDPKLGKPEPKSYFAIADGAKQHNMAKAHAGYYVVDGHRVPAMVIVKCGTPAEAKAAKPGNRGKRDSQLLLMNFLSRVTFDDRMTPLDYDMFRKIRHICGVTPDKFEIVLMVDADTKVLPTSLSYMITAMINDPMIMGLCGETRIANKTTSWVTWIQVFEYYISHHLGKCFESLFGGVTCLPGCFCMYRIKAPKPGTPNTYVPVLANPDIVEDYSENVVDTLHKKNLLLLGEDRFLTTLMLRTFPKRKMVFITQALCKTIVPDEFKVLLSQRRRWINSTVHNLMELVLVRDLCGTFCFSMQFVVGMELFGTSVLPAAIVFTVYLLVVLIKCIYDATKQKNMSTLEYVWLKGPVAPLIMLFAVLGLPGVLVMLTTQKVIYVLWMFVYLFGLPVWNLILPVYAFWHFDDFSWGETRKVQGDTGDDHSKKEGVFDASQVPLKRWHEYEKENRARASPFVGATSPFNGPQRGGSRSSPMGPRPGGPNMSPPGQRPFSPQQPGAAARPGGARPPNGNIPPNGFR